MRQNVLVHTDAGGVAAVLRDQQPLGGPVSARKLSQECHSNRAAPPPAVSVHSVGCPSFEPSLHART